MQISIEDVGQIKKMLSAARRTTDGGNDGVIGRFVEPRIGLLDQLMAEANHLIEGRRGTGKSTILQVLRHRALSEGIPVAFVDMEKHKHRNYPDVLVDLLLDVLNGLRPSAPLWSVFGKRRSAKRQFDRIIRDLNQILDDPESISREVTRGSKAKRAGKGQLKVTARKTVGVEAELATETASAWAESGSVKFTKIQRLRDAAPRLSQLLTRLVSETTARRSIIFIDDFYLDFCTFGVVRLGGDGRACDGDVHWGCGVSW